jgi:hypothetical protein
MKVTSLKISHSMCHNSMKETALGIVLDYKFQTMIKNQILNNIKMLKGLISAGEQCKGMANGKNLFHNLV